MKTAAVVTITQTLATPGAPPQLMVALSAPPSANGLTPAIMQLDRGALPPLVSMANATTYGAQLRAALCTHPAVQNVLQGLDQNIPANSGLYFQLMAPDVEDIRWETTTMDPGGFFALDSPTPVSRIAGPSRSSGDVRPFSWPLKILAFVSAAGVLANSEFKALTDEVAAARAAGLEVALEVFVGDQQLIAAAKTQIDAGALQAVTVAPMPANPEALLELVNDREAQIIHFFCHGISQGSQQFLELATIVDVETDAAQGSVQLPVWRLWTQAGAQAAWLVVLNCCESAAGVAGGMAAAGPTIGSMAFRLVKEGGVPACVGMMEPIAFSDANLVAGNFYKQLFKDLAPLKTANTDVVVDFSGAVLAPRQALRSQHQASAGAPQSVRWSLPALYTTGAALRVQPLSDIAPEQRIQLKTVSRFLTSLPPATPPGVRADALKLLEAIPEGLRPDWQGRFERAPMTQEQETRISAIATTLKTVKDTMSEHDRKLLRSGGLVGVPEAAWPDLEGRLALSHKDRTRILVVAEYLSSLPPPPAEQAARDEASALLADIPQDRRPDAAGNLPGDL